MCFSCDLAGFPEDYKARYRTMIAEYKKDREFFRGARAKILAEGHGITAIEYFDEEKSRLYIQVFTENAYAADIRIFPLADEDCAYLFGERTLSGSDLAEDGILIDGLHKNTCRTLVLEKIKA
jgi:hypothetical protein